MTRRLVDLSMPVHPDMLTFPRVPPPALCVYESHEDFATRIGAAEFGVTSLTGSYLVVQNDHVGTHMDARKHIVPTAGGPETIPLEYCMSDGVLLDFTDKEPGYVITVDDDALGRAMRLLLDRLKLVVEPSGAITVAALLEKKFVPRGPTVAVLSGGNIEWDGLRGLLGE